MLAYLGQMNTLETYSPFTVGSFLNNSFIRYIYDVYQFYNFTLSNMLFLKGLHISLGIVSCCEIQQQFQFSSSHLNCQE